MITTKTFRIFISSTFSDMVHERRYLQKEIFPKLREFCKRNGAKFQAVDLRWGVTDAVAQDHGTADLCLSEVRSVYWNVVCIGGRFMLLLLQNVIIKYLLF